MRQTWRWFGPADKVSLSDARQAGAEGIVSALHHLPAGEIWEQADIARRQREISTSADGRPTQLQWDVVESLPVSEAIKTQTGDWRGDIERYRVSLQNLAAQGLSVVCYNFMPVLDWTRTELAARRPNGALAMRFDLVDFAAFDIHILRRAAAPGSYDEEIVAAAASRYESMSPSQRDALANNITAGLPGAVERWSVDDLRKALSAYDHLTADDLRRHHIAFLAAIVDTADRLDMRLCCHPDDPPFELLGLPRTMSTAGDYREILSAVDSPAVGMTLCTGSLGVRSDNDLVAMIDAFGERIPFVHLRNVTRETRTLPCTFLEDEHLGGDVDMVSVVEAILHAERRRRAKGRDDWEIMMRPDHGQAILTDAASGAQPGYPAVGRLKGLAELRGVVAGLRLDSGAGQSDNSGNPVAEGHNQ